jgi:hypothetical protein
LCNRPPGLYPTAHLGDVRYFGVRLAIETFVSRATSSSGSPRRRAIASVGNLRGTLGIGPKDELEGMMAAQLVAAHNAAMECYRRAMIGESPFSPNDPEIHAADPDMWYAADPGHDFPNHAAGA